MVIARRISPERIGVAYRCASSESVVIRKSLIEFDECKRAPVGLLYELDPIEMIATGLSVGEWCGM